MVIHLKLSKDKKKKISIKAIISGIVIAGIFVITIGSLSGNLTIEKMGNNSATDTIYSVGKHLNRVVVGTGEFFSDLISFRSNANRVEELSKENELLRQELINIKGDETKLESLERLKKSLNYVDSNKRNELVSTTIIGKNDGDWYNSFILDAGFDRGIFKNSIVINGDGVVGIVYEASNRYSKAISIRDSKASISFKIFDNENAKGVITTSSSLGISNLKEKEKYLYGYLFDSKLDIKVGDSVISSGLGLYPENIPIGKVKDVIFDKNKSLKVIKVKPNVDFKRLDEVTVIPPRKID